MSVMELIVLVGHMHHFYSTSAHNLKDRLPTKHHSKPVYSRQGWKVADNWSDLWDGFIDSTLFDAEIGSDNYTSGTSSGRVVECNKF